MKLDKDNLQNPELNTLKVPKGLNPISSRSPSQKRNVKMAGNITDRNLNTVSLNIHDRAKSQTERGNYSNLINIDKINQNKTLLTYKAKNYYNQSFNHLQKSFQTKNKGNENVIKNSDFIKKTNMSNPKKEILMKKKQLKKITDFDQFGNHESTRSVAKNVVQHDVEELDKWQLENTMGIDDKDVMNQLRANEEKNGTKRMEKLQIPDLDLHMISMILRDENRELEEKDDKNKDPSEDASKMNDEEEEQQDPEDSTERKESGTKKTKKKKTKKNEVLQMETIAKNEFNRSILTNQIVRKLKKDFEKDDTIEELKDLDLRQIAAKTKIFATDTISSFSVLKNQYLNGISNVEYEEVYNEIKDKDIDMKITQSDKFRKTMFGLKSSDVKNSELKCGEYETVLLARFNECETALTKYKKNISKLTGENSEKQNSIRSQKSQLKQAQKKLENPNSMDRGSGEFDAKDDANQASSNNFLNVVGNKMAKKSGKSSNNKMDDYFNDNQDKSSRKIQLENKVSDLTRKLASDIEKNWKEINRTEKSVNEIKVKKVMYKFKLKQLYIKLMKYPLEAIANDKTLFLLIKQMETIKEKVKKNYFPDIIDNQNIEFIYEYIRLEEEFFKMEKTKKTTKKSVLNMDDANKKNLDSVFKALMAIGSKSEKNIEKAKGSKKKPSPFSALLGKSNLKSDPHKSGNQISSRKVTDKKVDGEKSPVNEVVGITLQAPGEGQPKTLNSQANVQSNSDSDVSSDNGDQENKDQDNQNAIEKLGSAVTKNKEKDFNGKKGKGIRSRSEGLKNKDEIMVPGAMKDYRLRTEAYLFDKTAYFKSSILKFDSTIHSLPKFMPIIKEKPGQKLPPIPSELKQTNFFSQLLAPYRTSQKGGSDTESKIKLYDKMNQMKKDEINRITDTFLQNKLSEQNAELMRQIIIIIFGKRESEIILLDFIKDSQRIGNQRSEVDYTSSKNDTLKTLTKCSHISQMSETNKQIDTTKNPNN